MSDTAKRPPPSLPHPETKGALGALLGFFIIAGAECQRLWPSGNSLVYLLVCVPLLAIWIAHLAGWRRARDMAGTAIDVSIYVLLVASLGGQLGLSPKPSATLAATLLFWAPLVAAWLTWRYRAFPFRLSLMLGIFFVTLAWQFAGVHQRIHEHLILALSLVFLIRNLAAPASLPTGNQNLDTTTGLPSPACFEAELAHVAAISDRYRLSMSLIGCRLSTQERGRHADVLRRYAEAIGERLRTSDTACRWDDDTFMVLLPNTTAARAEAACRGLREAGDALDIGLANICVIQRSHGDDPMSTLAALEHKLSTSSAPCPN
ncbi:MAG TPA: diguanylate cyclase [Azonexus sp.]|nr:diguanylate cyclase [Azonexus sp.]